MRITAISAARQRLDEEDGLSLVEVLVAMMVLSIVLLGVASTAVSSVASLRVSRERQEATAVASAAIEEARSYDFRELAHPKAWAPDAGDTYVTGTSPGPYYFDDDGDGSDPEEIVRANDGQITNYRVTSHGGRFTIRIFVTWYDDPGPPVVAKAARRITAVVTWTDPVGSAERQVRESTIVADADRGLAVPKFDVAPDELDQVWTGDPLCFAYVLRNIGERGGFDWRLNNHGGSPRLIKDAEGTTFQANGWDAQAWFDEPDYSVDGSGNVVPNTSSPNIFKESPVDDHHLESPRDLAAGESEHFYVCFLSKNPGAENHSAPNLTSVVRASIDHNVSETIGHDILKSTSPDFQLYLHDVDNTQAHDRTLGEPYAMDPTAPTGTDLRDWDQNQDPDAMSGIYLGKSGSGALTGEPTGIWTYNAFPSGTVLNGGTLSFYSGWSGMFAGTSTPTLTYEFALDVVDVAGNVIETLNLDVDSASYIHVNTTWMQVSTDFVIVDASNNPTTVTLPTGQEHLRLRLWCVNPPSGQNCHIAYDVIANQSFLTVKTP